MEHIQLIIDCKAKKNLVLRQAVLTQITLDLKTYEDFSFKYKHIENLK